MDIATTNYSQWATNFTDWTSVHGLVWYNRTENKFVRLCVTITAVLVVFGLPTFLIMQIVNWAQNMNVLSDGKTSQNLNIPSKLSAIYLPYSIQQSSG